MVEEVCVFLLGEHLLTAIADLFESCTVLVIASVGCGAREHAYERILGILDDCQIVQDRLGLLVHHENLLIN